MAQPERRLSPFLVRLRECLCNELADTLAGPVCLSGQAQSQPSRISTSLCTRLHRHTGRAVVRVVEIGSFSLTSAASMNPCPTGWLAAVEINVTRCVLDCKAEIPQDSVLETEALYALSDYAAMKRAVLCCNKQGKYKAEMQRWRPLGPDGCCFGGALELTARIE